MAGYKVIKYHIQNVYNQKIMLMLKQLTTINELAKSFNVNKSKVNYWYKQGKIEPIGEIGRMLIFNKAESTNIIYNIINKIHE